VSAVDEGAVGDAEAARLFDREHATLATINKTMALRYSMSSPVTAQAADH
jgi:hypothetical protein